ncbi:MAG: DUF3168 domain-containing protein [Pirellulales bacterium]|nr:DUF3168 domain-containing protein [Pirellulales bacterium]
MIVASVIQAQWAVTAELTSLVPAERVFTAQAAGIPALPYVVLRPSGAQPPATTTNHRIDTTQWELIAWGDRYDACAAVLAASQAAFDGVELATGDASVRFLLTEAWIEPADHARWRGVTRWRVRLQVPAAT